MTSQHSEPDPPFGRWDRGMENARCKHNGSYLVTEAGSIAAPRYRSIHDTEQE